MRFTVLFLAALFLVGTASATQNSTTSAPSIVIVGDSLSAAYGMKLEEAWPSLLQERLERDGYAHRVFNSSITGDTTQGGRSRLPGLVERHRPDVVLIELGGNDGLRGLPVGVTRDNLAAMIQVAQAHGSEVVLTEMRIPPNYGASYTEQFTQNYSQLESEYGVTLVPFILEEIALAEDLMQADGIHPSAAAQPLILERYWQYLEPLLTDAGG